MTNDTRLLSDSERKVEALRENAPMMLARMAQLREADFHISAVVLPSRLDPGAYDGPDATDVPAQYLGLPVVWGVDFGLVVDPRSSSIPDGVRAVADFLDRNSGLLDDRD